MSNFYGNYAFKNVTETCLNVPSSWTALPTTAMSKRQYLRVYNKGENKLYLSFDNTVASVKYRMAIGSGEMADYPVQENVTLYGYSTGGSNRVIVQEFS